MLKPSSNEKTTMPLGRWFPEIGCSHWKKFLPYTKMKSLPVLLWSCCPFSSLPGFLRREKMIFLFAAALEYWNTLIRSSPVPLILQGEETQLFQVFLTENVLQTSNHLCGPSLKHHRSNFILLIQDDVVFKLPNGKTFNLEKVWSVSLPLHEIIREKVTVSQCTWCLMN